MNGQSSTIRRTSAIAFGAVAIVLLLISWWGYRTARHAADANASVAHAYQALNALERLLTTLVEAETGARGFAVTGVAEYLDPFKRADAELGSRIDAVARLTVDNPVQQRSLAEVRTQATAMMRALREIVAHAGRSDAPVPMDLGDREKASMDAVRATLQRMRTEEQRLMTQRIEGAETAETISQAFMLGLIGAAFGVLAMSFYLVDSRAVELRRANELLSERVRERTADLEHALANEEQARREEHEARAVAVAASRSKDVFLARVSHELRTPLNALMGWTRMLRDQQLPPDRVEHAIASIDRNGAVLNTLVEDLLDMSRITAGKLQLEPQHLDISALVGESLNLLEPAASAKGVRLETDIERRTMMVDGDPTRLRQVVWNLLSNAIKFTPADGQVRLRVRTADDDVEMTVADTGQGIAPEFLPHVFEPFSQAEGGHGLGLGLAIVQQLVKAHGGRISVASPGIGSGATFTVCLPLVRVPERV